MPSSPIQASSEQSPAFRDPSLPFDQRVKDLLSRLTLEEKISQLRNNCPPIPRLGIPAYDYWNEALHGVARNGRATVFPQTIGQAATWDPDLIYAVADAISDEARAKHHEAMRKKGETIIYQGLTFWSPNVNIFRDPRWGRGQETWGEDPFLTGEMGAAFVRGLQGNHPRYMKAAACAKHYAVHSGPEKDRHTFNAVVSKRDLYTTYLPAFRKLVVDAKVEAIMGAYNRVLGEACCASSLLLGEILRGDWGFQGHVVSDCGALSDIHKNHKITRNGVETAALALKRGCDIGCDCNYFDHMAEAVQQGKVSEADIDVALARTFSTRFKLGMFDPLEMVPFASIPMSVVGGEKHRQLAYQAALESVVLLKNKDHTLPIPETVRSLLIVGPNATSIDVLMGNYAGLSDSFTTLLEGIIHRAPEGVKIEYRLGAQLAQTSKMPNDWSITEAASADLTIACMGLAPLLEGEEGDAILSEENGDRADIGLPKSQVEYLKKLAIAGAKVVLVLTGGSPIALGELEEMMHAIIFVWYPGQEGGRAVGDILFGDVSPSGKLPMTFPKSTSQLPPFKEYAMAGRTYRYASSEPLYPFGFGLSYTQFKYSDLQLDKRQLSAGDTVRAALTVTNAGGCASAEVVQFYTTDLETSVLAPKYSLVGFRRIQLEPGASQRIEFILTPEMLMLVNEDGKSVLEPGDFRLTIGGCSPGSRGTALGASTPLTTTFRWVNRAIAMIIDADTHVSPTGEDSFAITYDELVRRMDYARVDKALTWLRPPYQREIDASNAYVHQAVVAHPDRILGFGWADPNLGIEKAKEAVRKCIYEYGFFGVKLNGAQNSFYIDDPRLSLPVIEEIARTGKLLAFHVGADAIEGTHPFRVAKVARLFPELTILMVHMGGVGHADLTNAAIEMAQECPNLVLIGSAVRYEAVLKAIHTLGAQRVCFGSDTPFSLMHVAVAAYQALLKDELSLAEQAEVMAGSISRTLGLSIP